MIKTIIQLVLIFFLSNCSSTKTKSEDAVKVTDPNYLVTGYYYLSKDSSHFQRPLLGTAKNYYLNPTPIITVENFLTATVDKNNFGDYYIRIDLDETGGQNWTEATGKTIGDSLAIVINNELIHVARVNAQINAPVTAIMRSGLTKTEAYKYLSDVKAKMSH